MDINDLRGISTVFLLVAFVGLVIWAYSKKQKKEFDEAANLPFADDDELRVDNRAGNKEGSKP